MPPQPTLRIVEIFPSIQGEGFRQGEPTIFVRLAGCKLRCDFCDTKYAWEGGREMSADEVAEVVNRLRERFPAAWVALTGGEPFLQDLRRLARLLRKAGLKIQVETSGRRHCPLAVDWLTVSPKPPSYRVAPEFIRKAREVKLVVSRDLTLATVKKVRLSFPAATPVILQPESNRLWSRKLALQLLNETLAAGLKNIRISLQLHKVLGLR
jgi:7-cyano-7-deazaguanosine (preQ0) biosynthesis protein QueE